LTTEFCFYCFANDGKELYSKIIQTLAQFMPADQWRYSLTKVEQVQQDKPSKKTPDAILWQITVEVYPEGLKNALVCAKIIHDNGVE
jgi:hypothetical protein